MVNFCYFWLLQFVTNSYKRCLAFFCRAWNSCHKLSCYAWNSYRYKLKQLVVRLFAFLCNFLATFVSTDGDKLQQIVVRGEIVSFWVILLGLYKRVEFFMRWQISSLMRNIYEKNQVCINYNTCRNCSNLFCKSYKLVWFCSKYIRKSIWNRRWSCICQRCEDFMSDTTLWTI